MKTHLCRAAVIAGALSLAGLPSASAAEIKVLTAGAYKPVVLALLPDFEKQTGHKVTVDNGTAGELKKRIEGGEVFDVAVITPDVVDDLIAKGKIAAGSRARQRRRKLLDFIDEKLATAENERNNFNRRWGFRAGVSRTETARLRISQESIRSLISFPAGLDQLRLRHRRGDADQRFVGKADAAFRDRVHIAGEAKTSEVIEQVLAETAGAFEPVDLGGGESQRLEIIERVIEAGGEQEGAPRRQPPHEKLEHRLAVLATIQIGLDHVELVEIGEQRTGRGHHGASRRASF